MKSAVCVFVGLALCGVSSLGGGESPKTGTLVGVVRFTGKVPPPQKILTTDGGVLLHNDLIVDAKSQGLRFVVVTLENPPAAEPVRDAKPVVVDQRDMVFLPRVVAVRAGQKVRFENNDLCNHGVKADSVKKENQFNVVAGPNQPFEHTFEPQKGPVLITCPLHAWMKAYVYVTPHPYIAITDAQGAFRIENVPAGKRTFTLVHPDTGRRAQREVQIVAGKSTELKVELEKIGQ